MKREFTGKHAAAIIVTGFAIIIAVNLFMATLAVRGFGEAAPKIQDPIYFKWANHKGIRTQKELLRVIQRVGPPEKERVRVLEWFANAGGSLHAEVRGEAGKILEERPYVAARA